MGDNPKSPRRVVPIGDLAGRANVASEASANNQKQAAMSTHPDPSMRVALALIGAAQYIAAAMYFCTLAIIERAWPADLRSLEIEEERPN